VAKPKIRVELKGFEHITRKFDELGRGIQNKVMSPALKAGAKVILTRTKELVPVGTKIKGNKTYKPGRLRKSLKVKKGVRSRKSISWYIQTGTREKLGIAKSDKGYYPFSLEYGTQFIRARPYMRPALKSMSGRAIVKIAHVMDEKMTKIAAKGRKK
jgi:HK97 gp10 family phage protein